MNPTNLKFRLSRRSFLRAASALAAAGQLGTSSSAQPVGERPVRSTQVRFLNPRDRIPVSWIIDDSTCLVNLNRFAMPQFDEAMAGARAVYHRNWKEWPAEIPDSFVRKFGEWCAQKGVKGKYSIVPYPGCVGRLDRGLPGWSQRELRESLELVRTVMMPNWDIHPEMATHTRIIDLKTGQPYADTSTRFMENWEWTTGRSADEIGEYMAYALKILKEVGLTGEGITTPGSFGGKALPQLSRATFQAVRDVWGAEIPHYFHHLYSEGTESVAPKVELASGLDGEDPRCVVNIIGCAGDWTGGWDCVTPGGADKFISEDGKSGRVVDILKRGEPALMLAHWTGIYWNGEEKGFAVLKEVVARLERNFDNLIWMKLNEVSRYWAARELTKVEWSTTALQIVAPYSCPDLTLEFEAEPGKVPRIVFQGQTTVLNEVMDRRRLKPGTWFRGAKSLVVCGAIPKGRSEIMLG